MERLHKSCRKLVRLNLLLRFEEFQPSAACSQAHAIDMAEVLGSEAARLLTQIDNEIVPQV